MITTKVKTAIFNDASLKVNEINVELVINLKTAKALGLTITPSLQRADQVIE